MDIEEVLLVVHSLEETLQLADGTAMNHQHVGNSYWGPSMGCWAGPHPMGCQGSSFLSREQGISKVPAPGHRVEARWAEGAACRPRRNWAWPDAPGPQAHLCHLVPSSPTWAARCAFGAFTPGLGAGDPCPPSWAYLSAYACLLPARWQCRGTALGMGSGLVQAHHVGDLLLALLGAGPRPVQIEHPCQRSHIWV